MPNKYSTMKHFFTQIVIACFLLIAPLYTCALEVRNIELQSALNQPLDAKVELKLAKNQKIDDINPRLANRKVFKDSGLEMPYFLTKLKFEAKADKNGVTYIHITSKEIVREPYLNFLVEINWKGGRVIKEFVVLLNPVTLNEPSAESHEESVGQKSAPPPSEGATLYGPVQEAETLWVIAKKNLPSPSTPIGRMVKAIYLENPEAFIRGDKNLLKQGVTLRIPRINSVIDMTDGPASEPAGQENLEQQQNRQNIVQTTSKTTTEPEASAEQAPSNKQVVSNSKALPIETTQEADSTVQPQNQAAQTNQASNKTPDKLEVTAIPDNQVAEISQTKGEKVYPKNEIERLRGAIADSSEELVALKAMNKDLLKLESALKKKIEIIRKELNNANKAMSKISTGIETNTKKSTIASKNSKKVAAKPTPKTAKTPEPESDKSGANITTDSAPKDDQGGVNITTENVQSKEMDELDSEIAEHQSQHESTQTLKYLVIFLLLILLLATALIVLLNRGQLPTLDRKSISQFFARLTKIRSSSGSDFEKSILINPVDDRLDIGHLIEEPEPSAVSPANDDNIIKQEGEYNELLTRMSEQKDGLSALEPDTDNNYEAPTPDKSILDLTNDENGTDIDRTLTSVNVYIAYRRFSEAEFVLTKAIDDLPDNNSLKAKLLEIYAMKNDAKALSLHLDKYHHQLSTETPEVWHTALLKCARLIPDNPSIQKYLDESSANMETNSSAETGAASDKAIQELDDIIDEIDIIDLELSEDDDTEEIDMDDFFREQKKPDNS